MILKRSDRFEVELEEIIDFILIALLNIFDFSKKFLEVIFFRFET